MSTPNRLQNSILIAYKIDGTVHALFFPVLIIRDMREICNKSNESFGQRFIFERTIVFIK